MQPSIGATPRAAAGVTLVGREADLATVGKLLRSPDDRLVTLTAVGGVLGLSPADQRTLLDSGRSTLRNALDAHFAAAA